MDTIKLPMIALTKIMAAGPKMAVMRFELVDKLCFVKLGRSLGNARQFPRLLSNTQHSHGDGRQEIRFGKSV